MQNHIILIYIGSEIVQILETQYKILLLLRKKLQIYKLK